MSTGDNAGFSIDHPSLTQASSRDLPGQSAALAGVRERVIGSRAADGSFGEVSASGAASAGHSSTISELEQALAAKIKHLDSVADGIGGTNDQTLAFDEDTSAEFGAQKLADPPELTAAAASPAAASPDSATGSVSASGSGSPASPASTNLGDYTGTAPADGSIFKPNAAVPGPGASLPDAEAPPTIDTARPQPTTPYTAADGLAEAAGVPRPDLVPADADHPGVRVVWNPDGSSTIKIYPNDRTWAPLEIPNTSGEKGTGYLVDGKSWFPNDASHTYAIDTPTRIPWEVGRQMAQDELIGAPTPSDHNPATSQGTLNDALVLGQGHVHSYVVPSPDPSKYSDTIVNYTDSDHLLYPGYVLRRAMRADDGTVVLQTYGEGRGSWQAWPLSPGWRTVNYMAWQTNQTNILQRMDFRTGYQYNDATSGAMP